jgi:hypothetical protein
MVLKFHFVLLIWYGEEREREGRKGREGEGEEREEKGRKGRE